LSAVKNIVKTPVPGKGGAGGSVPTGGLNMNAPIVPTTSSIMTRIDQSSINALGNQAVKAYVVESDMTSSQKRIEAIKQKAKFG
jgi:hypothetical protein